MAGLMGKKAGGVISAGRGARYGYIRACTRSAL